MGKQDTAAHPLPAALMARICTSLTTSKTILAYAIARAPRTARGAKAGTSRGAAPPGHGAPSHSKIWPAVASKDGKLVRTAPCRVACTALRLTRSKRAGPKRALISATKLVAPSHRDKLPEYTTPNTTTRTLQDVVRLKFTEKSTDAQMRQEEKNKS